MSNDKFLDLINWHVTPLEGLKQSPAQVGDVGPGLEQDALILISCVGELGCGRLYQQAGIPEYWIVDLDARLVEHWRPRDERPGILSETLSWQLSDSTGPFELDLAAFFAEVLGG